jgi:hypothetical protein
MIGPAVGDAVLVDGKKRGQITHIEEGIVTITLSNGDQVADVAFDYVDVDKARLVKLAETRRESESKASPSGE